MACIYSALLARNPTAVDSQRPISVSLVETEHMISRTDNQPVHGSYSLAPSQCANTNRVADDYSHLALLADACFPDIVRTQ